MRFVHSLWTRPSLEERWNIDARTGLIANLWYYALSVAYLKEQNHEVVLHTDELGKECLNHIPYDEIYLTIEEKIPEGTCPIMWTSAKIYALQEEPLGSVLIDGDVFIKSQKCVELINAGPCDLFVQGLENIDLWNEQMPNSLFQENETYLTNLELPKDIKNTDNKAYNTGVLMFNNEELKQKYIDAYLFMMNQVLNSEEIINMWKENKNICPDLIIDQKFLYELAKKYQVRSLLDYSTKSINAAANDLGFQHVFGKRKYTELDICKRVLGFVDHDLYEATIKKEEEIIKKYFNN